MLHSTGLITVLETTGIPVTGTPSISLVFTSFITGGPSMEPERPEGADFCYFSIIPMR